jgi:hypothetical protein
MSVSYDELLAAKAWMDEASEAQPDRFVLVDPAKANVIEWLSVPRNAHRLRRKLILQRGRFRSITSAYRWATR